MKYAVEFRSGSYLTPDTDRTRRGGPLTEAMLFDSESDALTAAEPWFGNGAAVVPVIPVKGHVSKANYN